MLFRSVIREITCQDIVPIKNNIVHLSSPQNR